VTFVVVCAKMSFSSLLHFPPPPSTVPGDNSLCEFDSVLRSAHSIPTPRPMQIIRAWQKLVTGRAASSLLQGAEMSLLSGEMSAKSAFLPSKNDRQVRKAVSKWFEEGLISALEQLASSCRPDSAADGFKPNLWNRVVITCAKTVLAVYRMTANIHSSFNPHLLVLLMRWMSKVLTPLNPLSGSADVGRGHDSPVLAGRRLECVTSPGIGVASTH